MRGGWGFVSATESVTRGRENLIIGPVVTGDFVVSLNDTNAINLPIMTNTVTNSIRTCLWFRDGRGHEAAEFYCSLLPGSRIEKTFYGSGHGAFSVIDFSLGAVPYQILDAGPMFTLTEAVSISVATETQAESDRLSTALTADGGEQSHCGWLKDRFGVSWQVFPRRLIELTTSADPEVSAKAMAAMMTQMRIDIAAIEAAVLG